MRRIGLINIYGKQRKEAMTIVNKALNNVERLGGTVISAQIDNETPGYILVLYEAQNDLSHCFD